MNTLHRFTESLHAVNDFRQMWRREEADKKGRLLENVEGEASSVRTATLRIQ